MKRVALILGTTALIAACNDHRPASDPSAMNTTTAPAPEMTSTTPNGTDGMAMPTTPTTSTTTTTHAGTPTTAGGTAGATPNAGPASAPASPSSAPAPGTGNNATAGATPGAPANPNADNSANNAGSNSRGLTAGDQSNSAADVKITAQIRQAVMADKGLSFMAKNVKIITINGKVTLKGPVKSDQERSAIEVAAKRIAGDAQVDNQIEVKK